MVYYILRKKDNSIRNIVIGNYLASYVALKENALMLLNPTGAGIWN